MAEVMLGEEKLLGRAEICVDRAFNSLSSMSFWNSFSPIHTGIAFRKDVKPRGAKAR